MLDANATVEWTPEYMGKRMDDWLRNMGDWNISRRRYYGLPLPFYPCACGHLNVIGSRAELEERAVSGLDQLEELRRPWIDRVPVRCEECGEPVERIKEVGDVWLDAGIVPFSTLGWQNPTWIPEGYGDRRRARADDRGPSRPRVLGEVVPGRLGHRRCASRSGSGSTRSSSCRSSLTGRAPFKRVLGYEKMLDETGREMHSSWGNTIPAEDAFERMGADVMRWQYCAQPPDRNLLFGFGPAEEVKRKLLTFWNSVKFFVDYANIAGFRPSWESARARGRLEPLDRWLVERTHAFVADATAGYETLARVDVMRDVRGVPRRSLELVHPPLAPPLLGRATRPRLQTLWYALVQTLRVLAPILPFVTDHLWRTLVLDGPESVHLAGWPEVAEPDRALLDEIADVRRVVELGRQARSSVGHQAAAAAARGSSSRARASTGTSTRSPTSCA